MKTIMQYVLKPDQNMVLIPSDSILSVSNYNDDVVVNVLVESGDTEGRPFDFRIYGVGAEVDIEVSGYKFLGTVKLQNENTAHVFYKNLSSEDL